MMTVQLSSCAVKLSIARHNSVAAYLFSVIASYSGNFWFVLRHRDPPVLTAVYPGFPQPVFQILSVTLNKIGIDRLLPCL